MIGATHLSPTYRISEGYVQGVASDTHQEAADSFSSCGFDIRSGRNLVELGVARVSPSIGHRRPAPGVQASR